MRDTSILGAIGEEHRRDWTRAKKWEKQTGGKRYVVEVVGRIRIRARDMRHAQEEAAAAVGLLGFRHTIKVRRDWSVPKKLHKPIKFYAGY